MENYIQELIGTGSEEERVMMDSVPETQNETVFEKKRC